MFYIVRNLEYQQLIFRQSTYLRATKESGIEGENETENTSIVNTNLIHLRRYAKDTNSNSQQRIEITSTDLLEGIDNTYGTSPVGSGTSRECVKEVVCVKDFLPAMRAICDKLEEANEKVLVVSDIKVGLGYTNSSGHRAWRNILNMLKEASLVEEFEGKTHDRVVNCSRLLKKFDPRAFRPKITTCGYGGFDSEQIVKHGKRGQITDHFFELPIDHRIYDMVDAEGVRGITFPEVMDTVQDEGLIEVAFQCKLLEDVRVFPEEQFGKGACTEIGLVALSEGLPNLRYIFYVCRRMTNEAIPRIVRNWDNISHFRLRILSKVQHDYKTGECFDSSMRHCYKVKKAEEGVSFWGAQTYATSSMCAVG